MSTRPFRRKNPRTGIRHAVRKFAYLEAGAADKETVDVWARCQLPRVGSLHGAPVDNAKGLLDHGGGWRRMI